MVENLVRLVDSLYILSTEAMKGMRTEVHKSGFDFGPYLRETPEISVDVVKLVLERYLREVPLDKEVLNGDRSSSNAIERNTSHFGFQVPIWEKVYGPRKKTIDDALSSFEDSLKTRFEEEVIGSVTSLFYDMAAKLGVGIAVDPLASVDVRFSLKSFIESVRTSFYEGLEVKHPENPSLLYSLCFQELAKAKGLDNLEDQELIETLDPESLELFQHYMNRQIEFPTEEKLRLEPIIKVTQPDSQELSSFLLTYDGFGEELLRKTNERFGRGTVFMDLEDLQPNQEIQGNLLKRAAWLTTIYGDSNLRSRGILPITPLESELLLMEGKLPKPSEYWEDLAIILYSQQGNNQSQIDNLYPLLIQNYLGLITELTLEQIRDISSPLLIVHPGLELRNCGLFLKPLQGLTQVYAPAILQNQERSYGFDYGLDQGVPNQDSLNPQSQRALYMSSEGNKGLLLLYRKGVGSDLDARSVDLRSVYAGGRVNFKTS